jgi:hypothetical protein
VNLAAVMSPVIEKMRQRPSQWRFLRLSAILR